MRPGIVWALFLLFSSALPAAGEHAACHHPNNYEGYNAQTLLSIAHSCEVPEVANLFYNRANFLLQLRKYIQFEQSLHNLSGGKSIAYIDSYRIHIGLAEALLSRSLNLDASQNIRDLNSIYERSGEIAELRFRGYDLLADRLERQQRPKLHSRVDRIPPPFPVCQR